MKKATDVLRHPERMRVVIRVRCSGHIHTVAVSHRGRFITPGHTEEEFSKYQAAIELGGKPCRCLELRMAWVRYERNECEPAEMQIARQHGYEVALRIQRRLRRKRLREQIREAAPGEQAALKREYRTLRGPGLEWPADLEWPHIEDCAPLHQRIIDELVRRGWPADVAVLGEPQPRFRGGNSYSAIVGATPRAIKCEPHLHHCHTYNLGNCWSTGAIGGAGAQRAIPEVATPAEFDLQTAADYFEVQYINQALHAGRKAADDAIDVWFRKRVKHLKRLEFEACAATSVQVSEAATCNLWINHPVLTTQAARMLVRLYATLNQQVARILKVNDEQIKNANRFPYPSSTERYYPQNGATKVPAPGVAYAPPRNAGNCVTVEDDEEEED